MTLSVTHAFASGYTDGTDASKLQPSNWNAAHVLSGIASLAQGGTGPFGAAGTILAGGTVPAWTASPTITGPMTVDKGTAAAISQLLIGKTQEAASGDFAIGLNSVANAFGTRRDHVLAWGYNKDPQGSGGKINAAEHVLVYDIENFYNPSAGDEATESHIGYTNRAGTAFRPYSLHINLLTDVIDQTYLGDTWNYAAANGTNYLQLSQAQIVAQNGATFDSQTNNHDCLRQINATATGYVTLVWANSSNQLVLGWTSATDICWSKPLVSVGGGAAATLSTIGGSGPATAVQNSWMRVVDSNGVPFWVPVWK